jgi:hypothetical protein
MPILYIVGLVVSISCIVHCIRTHRNTTWVVVLIFLPLLGATIYFFVEIFPELSSSRGTRRAMRGLRGTLNPEGDLRRLENEVKVTGNIHSRQRYADELIRLGRAKEGLEVYKNCLTGVFADDPKLLLGYAHAQFAAEQPAGARATLDQLIAKNPDFKSADGHLLYARALETEGDTEKALSEYSILSEYFPGAEAGVRYAKLLKKTGKGPQARKILESLLERAKFAPAHYRRAQRNWLDEAESEMRGLAG